MAKLLRLPEAPAGLGAEVPLLGLKELPAAAAQAAGATVAVRISPADRVEELVEHLDKLALVAIEFPNPGDGRGYSSARLLRQRFGFKGEIRAVGAGVKQDLLFFMLRCGIDSFDLAPTENEAEARAALHRFTLAYQPAVPCRDVREARFTAAR